jgi:hypothetical protein
MNSRGNSKTSISDKHQGLLHGPAAVIIKNITVIMAVKDNAEVFVVKDIEDIYVIESLRRTQTHRHQKHHDITAIIREH